MKALIVEDDFTSRLLLQKLLEPYGECHIATNGLEAVEASRLALDAGQPYDLICLDIMMPEMDGQAALKAIRDYEVSQHIFSSQGSRIFMTTALRDMKNVATAYRELCDGYLVKPVEKEKLVELLAQFRLLRQTAA